MSQGERILFQRFLLAIALIAVVSSALIVPNAAQAAPHSPSEVPQSQQIAGSRTFSETGFTVANYFLKTWNATPNALFVYGLPISQPFIEQSFSNPGEFYRVQYFERAILEEHPENIGGPYYILGRLLGSKLAASRSGEAPFKPAAKTSSTYDDVTKHNLSDSPAPFKSFYDSNGGLNAFGRPLSEQFQELNKADGKTYWVQYFERQRMEWHPDQPKIPRWQPQNESRLHRWCCIAQRVVGRNQRPTGQQPISANHVRVCLWIQCHLVQPRRIG